MLVKINSKIADWLKKIPQGPFDIVSTIIIGILAAIIGANFQNWDYKLVLATVFILIIVLFKIALLKVQSTEEPIKHIIEMMNAPTSIGRVENKTTDEFLSIYEKGISEGSSVYIITNLVSNFDMQECVIDVIAQNLTRKVSYKYYIAEDKGLTQDINNFIDRLTDRLDKIYSSLSKSAREKVIYHALNNLEIYRFNESPVLCSFALLRDTNKEPVGYWYTINCENTNEAIFLTINRSHIASLEHVFHQISNCSWKQKINSAKK